MRRALVSGVLGLALLSSEAGAHGRMHVHFGPDTPDGQGPSASELSSLLAALGRSDPLVCNLAVDAVASGLSLGDATGEASPERQWTQARGTNVTAPDAVALLGSRLGDTQRCVRRFAAELLGRSQSAEALARLRTALGSTSPAEREAAALGLAERGDPSMRELLERALHDADASVAAAAAYALGSTDDARAVPPLLQAARHKDARVRRAAVASLGDLEDARAVPVLLDCLRDADTDVRKAAAAALGETSSSAGR
jgi:HEAT repeat protein